MTVPAEVLREALRESREIVDLTEDRGRELVAPIFREIMALEAPDEAKQVLLVALRKCCAYNTTLNSHAQSVCRTLEELTQLVEEGRANPLTAREPSPLAVRQIVRALRPVLRVLADPLAHTAADYVAAARDMESIVAQVKRERLLSSTVRHELGAGPYRQLQALVEGDGAELINFMVEFRRSQQVAS
jgi:hypothetical protein